GMTEVNARFWQRMADSERSPGRRAGALRVDHQPQCLASPFDARLHRSRVRALRLLDGERVRPCADPRGTGRARRGRRGLAGPDVADGRASGRARSAKALNVSRAASLADAGKPIFGSSEMAERIQSFDWSTTPLGPVESWPQSLTTMVRTVLASRYAMWMGWGPDFIFFCNDAYRPTLGMKHTWAIGASARRVWAEIWPAIGPPPH